MSAPSFKFAPLPLLICAVWPQLAQSSEARVVLMPPEISPRLTMEQRKPQLLMAEGQSGLRAAEPLAIPVYATAINESVNSSVETVQVEDAVVRHGDVGTAVPAATDLLTLPAVSSLVQTLAKGEKAPSPDPSWTGHHQSMPVQTNLSANHGNRASHHQQEQTNKQKQHYASAPLEPSVPSAPSTPVYPDMPWMVPQLLSLARSNNPQPQMPSYPNGVPMPAAPGMLPYVSSGTGRTNEKMNRTDSEWAMPSKDIPSSRTEIRAKDKIADVSAVSASSHAQLSLPLDLPLPADRKIAADSAPKRLGLDDDATAGAPAAPEMESAGISGKPAVVSQPGKDGVAPHREANYPLPPPASMAPMNSTWWVPNSPVSPPVQVIPNTVIPPVSPIGSRLQPSATNMPVAPRMAEANGLPAPKDAEMQMRANGIWWLPPVQKMTVKPPVVLPHPAVPAAAVTRKAIEPMPAVVSAPPQMKAVEISPEKPVPVAPDKTGMVVKPPSVKQIAEPTPAAVSVPPKVKVIEVTPVKPAQAAPSVAELPVKTAPVTKVTEPIPAKASPLPASKAIESAPIQAAQVSPSKTASGDVSVPSRKEAEPVVATSKPAVTSDLNREPRVEPRKPVSLKDESATAAAPSLQPLSEASAKTARPILEPTPIPPVQIAAGVVLPKSNPVLQPKLLASIPAKPRQLPLPFPTEERKTFPVLNKAVSVPSVEPKTVLPDEAVDEVIKEPVKSEPAETKSDKPEPVKKEPAKAAPKQTSRVVDPCEKGFRPVRSKVKRPKSKIMTTRKPAYDPCKGKYEPVKEVAVKPKKSKTKASAAKQEVQTADSKVKRMCFEGGEIKPCK